ncbi:MAG: hypothetical protein IJT73_11075 [Selenomonadaceae bacterium]|nr:hypothetical protein [Selenomonadaceae bacterium]
MWNFILAAGFVALIGAAAYEGEKHDKELRQKEEKLWNHGFCTTCGRKYKARSFFPPGSRGEYKHISIKCHKCKIESVLTMYKPPENEFQDYKFV